MSRYWAAREYIGWWLFWLAAAAAVLHWQVSRLIRAMREIVADLLDGVGDGGDEP